MTRYQPPLPGQDPRPGKWWDLAGFILLLLFLTAALGWPF